jgi:Leucine-rich repeat (LRR) protein
VTSDYDLFSIFAHGESLKQLKIHVNSSNCIENLAFCFPQLEELDLAWYFITMIGLNEFSNFRNLKKLNLSNCSIRNIDPEAFSHLILDELDLCSNKELTTLQIKGPAVPKVLKADNCEKLEIVKLLDYSVSPMLTGIHELFLPSIAAASAS